MADDASDLTTFCLPEGGRIAPYSDAVRVGDLLFLSGTAIDRVVKTTVFLTDMADVEAVNAIYAEAFGDHWPARSAIAVAGLPMGALVEIEMVAALRQ